MTDTLTYEELEYHERVLENEARWRRQAEHALQESEKRFKLLFEYAPDMYFIFKAGKIHLRSFENDIQNLIVGRIIVAGNTGR